MKRVILSATLLLGLAGFANAQTGNGGGSNGSRSTSAVSNVPKANKGHTNKGKSSAVVGNKKTTLQNGRSTTLENVEIITNAGVDNTREFLYPNGQVSTPTGHEATSINGGYAALGRNTNTAANTNTANTTTKKKQQ